MSQPIMNATDHAVSNPSAEPPTPEPPTPEPPTPEPARIAVGIDVAKEKLDVCLLRPNGKRLHKPFANDPDGHQKLLRFAQQYAKEQPSPCQLHFCLEATGSYSEAIALRLAEANEHVSVVNPFQIKHYGLSIGVLTKNDRADAKLIATYCHTQNPPPWRLCAQEMRTLLALCRRLEALKTHRAQELNRQGDPGCVAPVRASIQKSLAFLDQEIARVEHQIDGHIKAHPGLRADRELLLSSPGVGPTLSACLLAELQDIQQFASAQSVAAYAGLNPRENQSGKSEKPTRMSKFGNARLRSALFLPALSAYRCNPLLADLYARLVKRGLKPKAALGAVMRKLLMLAYGVLKTRVPFDPAFAGNAACQAT